MLANSEPSMHGGSASKMCDCLRFMGPLSMFVNKRAHTDGGLCTCMVVGVNFTRKSPTRKKNFTSPERWSMQETPQRMLANFDAASAVASCRAAEHTGCLRCLKFSELRAQERL